jgi:hypothetical protein
MVALTYDDKHNDGSEVHMAENCVVEAPTPSRGTSRSFFIVPS